MNSGGSGIKLASIQARLIDYKNSLFGSIETEQIKNQTVEEAHTSKGWGKDTGTR